MGNGSLPETKWVTIVCQERANTLKFQAIEWCSEHHVHANPRHCHTDGTCRILCFLPRGDERRSFRGMFRICCGGPILFLLVLGSRAIGPRSPVVTPRVWLRHSRLLKAQQQIG